MGKGSHKVFSIVVKDISQELTSLGESCSENSHFILEPRNFAQVAKLSENIKKPCIKATLKQIKNLINNNTFLIEYQNEGEPVPPCMDVYKAKNQSDGSLDKLKLRIGFVHIHAWSSRFTLIFILNQESLIVDQILYLLESCFQPKFLNIL